MIEPVNVPILLDLELEEEELDLSVEEAEEYAAQIGSLITISEVYGGLPSGGSSGDIIIKNSEEDYDASWYAPASVVEERNGLPVTSEAVYDAIAEAKEAVHFAFVVDDSNDFSVTPAVGVTINAIISAAEEGKICFADISYTDESCNTTLRLCEMINTPGMRWVYFTGGTYVQTDNIILSGRVINNNDVWATMTWSNPKPYNNNPAALGVANPGNFVLYARGDHVHPMPSAADIGAYELPSGGIPSTDLSAAVQTSLGKADTAIQEHQSLADYRKATDQDAIDEAQNTAIAAKYSKPSDGIPASDLVSGITIPSGGSTGQVLKKTSGMDYDTEWADETSGISDYNTLNNKPQIAGVPLSGDKSLSDLGIAPKPMLVTLSYTGSGDTYTADKTYAEIRDAIAAGREVLVNWGPSILRSSAFGATWIGYDDSQILEFILHSDSSWTGIITDLGMYRTAEDQDTIDQQQNAAIEAKYTKPSGGIPATDLAAGVIPTVPSNVSAFENDAGYLTLSDLPIYDGGVS